MSSKQASRDLTLLKKCITLLMRSRHTDSIEKQHILDVTQSYIRDIMYEMEGNVICSTCGHELAGIKDTGRPQCFGGEFSACDIQVDSQ